METSDTLEISWARDLPAADVDAVLALNQANVPEVGPLDRAALVQLAGQAEWVILARLDGDVVGFALLLVEDSSYGSPNYAWFSARHERFLYVDRIAVSEAARGAGIGRRIYERALEEARAARRPALCAEVNVVPPNEPSMAFHRRMGFVEVGRESPKGDGMVVAMLECAAAGGRGSGAMG